MAKSTGVTRLAIVQESKDDPLAKGTIIAEFSGWNRSQLIADLNRALRSFRSMNKDKNVLFKPCELREITTRPPRQSEPQGDPEEFVVGNIRKSEIDEAVAELKKKGQLPDDYEPDYETIANDFEQALFADDDEIAGLLKQVILDGKEVVAAC